jgi:nitroreductase/NAD-dependent dihydropyrimidine dehydrogenase PreA subunit
MNLITIDSNKCKRDGFCVIACPRKLLKMNEETKLPVETDNAENMCMKCGHCIASCPHDAISVKGMTSSDFIPLSEEKKISYEQADCFFKSRRSIRNYLNKRIEKEKIISLIDTARFAPTGGNSQQVRWFVITSRETLDALINETIHFMKGLIENDHPMAKSYKLDEIVDAWILNRHDGIFRGAPALVIAYAPKAYGLAVVDSTIALTFFDTTAPSLGLGSCWAGFFMMAAGSWKPIMDLLKLPEGNIVCGALMLGYPKYKYYKIPPRNKADVSWME